MLGRCYIIVVTWALMICLICMPSALGPVAPGLWAYISGKSLVPMLQLSNVCMYVRTYVIVCVCMYVCMYHLQYENVVSSIPHSLYVFVSLHTVFTVPTHKLTNSLLIGRIHVLKAKHTTHRCLINHTVSTLPLVIIWHISN